MLWRLLTRYPIHRGALVAARIIFLDQLACRIYLRPEKPPVKVSHPICASRGVRREDLSEAALGECGPIRPHLVSEIRQ